MLTGKILLTVFLGTSIPEKQAKLVQAFRSFAGTKRTIKQRIKLSKGLK